MATFIDDSLFEFQSCCLQIMGFRSRRPSSAALVFPQPVRRNSHPKYYVISQAVTYGDYGCRLLALGVPDVVDHFCNLIDSMVTRSCEQLYPGWIHSYPAGTGCDRSDLPASLRQTNGRLTKAITLGSPRFFQ